MIVELILVCLILSPCPSFSFWHALHLWRRMPQEQGKIATPCARVWAGPVMSRPSPVSPSGNGRIGQALDLSIENVCRVLTITMNSNKQRTTNENTTNNNEQQQQQQQQPFLLLLLLLLLSSSWSKPTCERFTFGLCGSAAHVTLQIIYKN